MAPDPVRRPNPTNQKNKERIRILPQEKQHKTSPVTRISLDILLLPVLVYLQVLFKYIYIGRYFLYFKPRSELGSSKKRPDPNPQPWVPKTYYACSEDKLLLAWKVELVRIWILSSGL